MIKRQVLGSIAAWIAIALGPPVALVAISGQTTFTPHRNKASGTLRIAHAAGSTTLALRPGHGARFGSPTPQRPIRLEAKRGKDGATVIYKVTGRRGDDLTVGMYSTGPDAQADIDLAAGDAVYDRWTAGDIADRDAAINAIERGSGRGGPPGFGPRTLDIRDFGARSGDPSFDNTPCIQAALDAAATPGLTNGLAGTDADCKLVFIPSGVWYVKSPVFLDGDFVNFAGEGQSSVIQATDHFWPVVMGVRRYQDWRPGGNFPLLAKSIPTGQRPDLFGKLDRSAASATGQRWGLATRQVGSPYTPADHIVQFAYGPFSHGPRGTYADGAWDGQAGWEHVNKFTLEVSLERAGGGAISQEAKQYTLVGAGGGDDATGVQPFALYTCGYNGVGTEFYFAWRCQEDAWDANGRVPVRIVKFGNAKAPARHIAVQVDMSTDNGSGYCPVLAWVDKVQVAVTPVIGASGASGAGYRPFAAASNLHFRQNSHFQMNLGCRFESNYPEGGTPGIWPGTFYGLRMSVGTLYANDGVGQPQRRIDNATLNDAKRYFSGDPTADPFTLAYLPLTDRPHEGGRSHDRLVTVIHGAKASGNGYTDYSYGLVCENLDEITANLVATNSVSNLQIGNNRSGYGAGILAGRAFQAHISDIRFLTGWTGIGSMSRLGYYFKLRDIYGDCYDSLICMQNGIVQARDLFHESCNRASIRVDGCNLHVDGLIVNHLIKGEAIVKATAETEYGVMLSLHRLFADIEEPLDPARWLGAVYCERNRDFDHGGTRLVASDISVLPLAPAGVELFAFDLRGRYQSAAPQASFHLSGAVTALDVVRTDGVLWRGTIDASAHQARIWPERAAGSGPRQWIKNTGPGGIGAITAIHHVDGLPTEGKFAKGCHIFHVRNPQVGQYSSYRVLTGGDLSDPAHLPVFGGVGKVEEIVR